MTAIEASNDLQDHPGIITNTFPSFDPNLVDASVKNDSDHIPQKGLCAVLPAYNEELVIGSVVLLTKQFVNRVIVVDDGSSDRTSEVAKLAGAEVIKLEHNTGKANTILSGLRHARKYRLYGGGDARCRWSA